jgi:hypothetical protein
MAYFQIQKSERSENNRRKNRPTNRHSTRREGLIHLGDEGRKKEENGKARENDKDELEEGTHFDFLLLRDDVDY